MLDVHAWLFLIGVCTLAAMTPGASLAVVARHTVRGSAAAGVGAGLAHAAGIAVYATATVTGLAAVLNGLPQLAIAIRLAGSLFLLWLAFSSWRAAKGPAPEPFAGAGGNAMRDGFLIAFLNPKVALFFLALFSQFVSPDMAIDARVQVAATAVVIDGAWYSLVALALARGPVLAALRRHHDKMERATAIVLALVAVAVWL